MELSSAQRIPKITVQVPVPQHTSGRGEAAFAPVSLPAAPWQNADPAPQPRGSGKTVPECAVVGCKSQLAAGNSSGVCRMHNHRKPWCRCKTCVPDQVRPTATARHPAALGQGRPANPAVLARRNIVVTKVNQGVSRREIARELGITIGSVKQDIFQAKRNPQPEAPNDQDH